ncbi:MAG: Uncharacterised protein [Porticoccaceae bacterium UBA1117]|nr:hypothetical protein [Porticoccaceae bacterium]CAI8349775.1 MAG: Uncharacterised protein [Porticoccaceae bacterium UBA1117]
MRSLAEFIMRGRAQACLVALLGVLVPLIGPAAVGLVTLRKGSVEGALVALWASLPFVVSYFAGQSSPFVAVMSILALANTLIVANVLRGTASWSLALVSDVCVAVGFVVVAGVVFQTDLGVMMSDLTELFVSVSEQLEKDYVMPDTSSVLAWVAWMTAFSALLGVVVARWWQALLFNPGGFQQEFQGIRLESKVGLGCLLLVILGFTLLSEFQFWLQLASIPLIVCGLSLLHYTAKVKKAGGYWLVLMYLGLFLGPVMSGLLVALGAIDSVLNLRARLVADNQS